jgi:GT2 family glycosyltransferase/O-antigen ligase
MSKQIKLSIIIVSWNVRALLEKCLASIFLYAPQYAYDIIVVDNASHDASADMIAQKFPQVNCIRNTENKGFSKANNQGIAIARGEYVFLLNPDTEGVQGSLEKLISCMEQNSKIGICAPKLLNADGTLQPSIRRFPTPFSQLLLLFKLRHLKRQPQAIQNYLNEDFDYEKAQEVEQPQGAALLIRKSVLDAVGMLDENFWIWFEEVDFCRRTVDAGYKIWYAPESTIIHHGGMSFRQRFSLDRQIIFYTSCAYYLWKHFTWKSLYAIIPMKTYTAALSAWKDESKRFFFVTFFLLGLAEIFSLIGFVYPVFMPFGFFIAVIGIAVLSFFKLEYGVMAVVAELIIGSKGYLLSLSVGTSSINIRYALFSIVCSAWFFHKKNGKRQGFLPRYIAIPFIILGLVVFGGMIHGYINGYSRSAIFHDVNAWPFFLILIPFFAGLVNREAITRLFSVAGAALTVHIFKVLALFYIMGHSGFGAGFIEMAYKWARATGIAEITPFGFNIFRIFFQSQIYVVVALCVLLAYAGVFFMRRSGERIKNIMKDFFKICRKEIFLFIGVSAVILVSFSRSFWLGACSAALAWFAVMLFQKYRLKVIVLVSVLVVAGSILSGVFLFAFSRFPIPLTKGGGFDFNSILQRTGNVSEEAAAASRWNSLPVLLDAIKKRPFFGYGFGKELTYISQDPRILESNPTGVYTTYAFEWGYLDILVKIGVLGVLAYLFLLTRILAQGWRIIRSSPLAFGVWLGLIAVMVTHGFSPYLNHPLGIGYVALVGVLFQRLKEDT